MDNVKSDKYYIHKVIENIDAIIHYIANKSFDEFVEDELLIDAIMFRLIQMAENSNSISKAYKENHQEIKWGLISGFRNRIVHDYGKTDYKLVYEIITEDINKLKLQLTDI